MLDDQDESAAGPEVRPVLVVEDHEDSRELLCDLFKSVGIPCVTATDGNAALLALRTHRPCVILLDLMMPEMDGRQFRQEQRQLADRELASIPVVLLSALPDHHAYARALGAIATIRKPIDLDRLLDVVREYFPSIRPSS